MHIIIFVIRQSSPVYFIKASDVGKDLLPSSLEEGGDVALPQGRQICLGQRLQRVEVAQLLRHQVLRDAPEGRRVDGGRIKGWKANAKERV